MTQRTLRQTSKPISLSGRLSRTAIKYWKCVTMEFLRFLSGRVTKKLCSSKSEIHPHGIQNVIFNALKHTHPIQKFNQPILFILRIVPNTKILTLGKQVATESLLEVIILNEAFSLL
jgi:hypothetical protein